MATTTTTGRHSTKIITNSIGPIFMAEFYYALQPNQAD